MSQPQNPPSPMLLFETINAYQRTAAIKAAIELDLFTAVAEGARTPGALAERCGAAERGVRILSDFLTILGFLVKDEEGYSLTPDSAVFLDRRSPAYMGGAVEFLLSPTLTGAFEDFTGAVRKGGTTLPGEGSVDPDHPVWVRFARAMKPMMAQPARLIAEIVPVQPGRPLRILDIAAGHGVFGIAFAERYPEAELTALDWAAVLEVAQENAEAAGVADRYRRLPGNAFDTDFGEGYDLVLLTNFLHHFDPATCEGLLRKVRAALAEGGRAVTLEFVPDENRVTPPGSASFAVIMLGTTTSGDAYTFSELERMFRNAGFSRSEIHSLGPGMQQVIVSEK